LIERRLRPGRPRSRSGGAPPPVLRFRHRRPSNAVT
jgi:hypothetical protein